MNDLDWISTSHRVAQKRTKTRYKVAPKAAPDFKFEVSAARSTLAKHYRHGEPIETAPPNAMQQELLARYLKAWEQLDVDNFVAVLKHDATYTMPPLPQWYAGRQAIRTFFEWAWKAYDGYRMVPTAANGQPAFAAYARHRVDAPWDAHSIHVLTIQDSMISRLTLFVKPESPRLFTAFGLPLVLPADADRATWIGNVD